MDDETLIRFRRAYWQVFRDLDGLRLRQWEQHGLTLPQLRVLTQIRRTPGITTRDLSRLLSITVSTTSGLVQKLADRGLVQRTTSEQDRRQTPLYLTEAGATLAGELSGASRAYLALIAEQLGDDVDDITAALERLAAASAAARAEQEPLALAAALAAGEGRS